MKSKKSKKHAQQEVKIEYIYKEKNAKIIV
jgi:hypothetical protein